MIKSTNSVYLHKINTLVPETSYPQEVIRDFIIGLGWDEKNRKFLEKIYSNSGIDKRHTVIDDYDKDFSDYTFYPKNKDLEPEVSTKKRNDLFIDEANRLSLKSCQNLFSKDLNMELSEITHLITISCTGFSAPGFDYYLLKELPLPKNTRRYHIGFMGCYAALTGLSLAQTICLADEKACVLMVNVELCSLHFQKKAELDTMVANAIFADGVTSAVISSRPNHSQGNKISLDYFNSQLLPDSVDDMAWKLGETGFDMRLSAYVPRIIEKNIDQTINAILAQGNMNLDDIKIWALHPGGKAIIQKVQNTMGLSEDDLQLSYDTLREFGNMSSSTLMFILKKILEDQRQGPLLAIAFGPGLTIESGIFRKTT
ncbi:MAG: type III polyketide synthase [Spirochaetales bacterium]|nr:type III polyketide synthase [Spirochaetales bacterium]